MSTETTNVPTPGDEPRTAGWHTGPYAEIVVAHEPSTNAWTFEAQTLHDVELFANGHLVITWDAPGEPVSISFLSAATMGGTLDGFTLGWSGDRFPADTMSPLSYQAVKPPADTLATTGVIDVMFQRHEGVLTYLLTVEYPDGSRHVIDPKICNKGDGLEDGCA